MTDRFEKRRSYTKTARAGLAWGVAREGVTSLLILLPAAMVLARLLSPEEMGVVAAAWLFMQLGARLTQFGFGVALVRANSITPAHVSSAFVVSLGIGLLAWLAATLAAPAAGMFLRSPEAAALIPTAALTFLIMPFGTIPTAILTREMRYRESATSDWFATTVENGTAILLAWNGWSYWSLIYARLAGDSTRAFCRAWMVAWRPRLSFSATALRDLFSFGAGVYAKNFLEFTTQNVDNLIVARALGLTALGFYDKAFQTMHKLTAKINVAGPSVSFRIFALIEGEPARFRRAYSKVLLSVTLVGFPMITGMIVAAREIIDVLFGSQWLPAVLPFQLLCLAGFLQLLNTYASAATQAKGEIWGQVRRQAVFSIILVSAIWPLSHWGIGGVAGGVALATLFLSVMLHTLLKRLTGMSWADLFRPQIPAIICSVGLIAILIVTRITVFALSPQAGSAATLAAQVFIGAGYYMTFLLVVPLHEMRAVVRETLEEVAPATARWLDRHGRGGSG